jgi:hypothetical protein
MARQTIDDVKRAISLEFLGREGVNAVGIGRGTDGVEVIRVYLDDDEAPVRREIEGRARAAGYLVEFIASPRASAYRA